MVRIFRGERPAAGEAQAASEQETKVDTPAAEPERPTEPQRPPEQGQPSEPRQADRSKQPETEQQTGPLELPPQPPAEPGFLARGQIRRRARFLRAARELAYRDLGGLVFDLHRFGQRNDDVVQAKLATLGRIDAELRALEAALKQRTPLTVLRQAGVSACPRCAAIHGSFDRFCPACGLPVRQDERPIAAPAPIAAQPPMGAPPPFPAAAPPPATQLQQAPSPPSQSPSRPTVQQPTQAFSVPAAPAEPQKDDGITHVIRPGSQAGQPGQSSELGRPPERGDERQR